MLLATSGEGTVTAWNVDDGALLSTIRHDSDLVYDVDVNASGTLGASAGWDGVRVWDPASGQARFEIRLEDSGLVNWMQAVAWSPVADVLATGSTAGPTLIVDATGATLQVLERAPGSGVFGVAFSPDGKLLATAIKQSYGERWSSGSHRVVIWDWQAGTVLTTIETSSLGLAFDPSGTRLATSSFETGRAEIWDVATGDLLATLLGHAGGAHDVSWHPDPGRDLVATAGADGTVRLWDGSSGLAQLVLHGHIGSAWRVAFSPDGSRLASTADDGTVRVWELGLDALIDIAREKLTRELSDAECLEFLHAACVTAPADGLAT
jgi:WD40 repeat protein